MSVILAALILVTVVVSVFDNKKEAGNFRSVIADVNIDEVDRVDITLPGEEETFTLRKIDVDQWELLKGRDKYPAESSSVSNLLSEATGIKVKQVVAKDRDKWGEYNVNDSLGTTLRMFQDKDLLSGLVVGRMSFSQPRSPYQRQPDAFTYLRVEDDEMVYSTEGMLSMIVSRGADYFRNASITRLSKENMNRVSFNYPADSSFVLAKNDSIWKINGIPVDSTETANYLNTLSNFSNRNFASEADIEGRSPEFNIRIEGDNMEAISIEAWPGNNDNEYFVTSSQNIGSVFSLNGQQFERLFSAEKYFYGGDE